MSLRKWISGQQSSQTQGKRSNFTFPDTGPQKDGTRTKEQWLAAINEDFWILKKALHDSIVDDLDKEDRAHKCAIAFKESRRLNSDILRFAQEVHGISREEIEDSRRML